MNKETVREVLQYILPLVVAVIIVCVVFSRTFPELRDVVANGCTYEDLMNYLDSIASIKGLVAVALLQTVQVVSIFLPGAPIQIAAGIVYGFVVSFIVTFTSFAATNMAVFLYVRKNGNISFSPDSKSGKRLQMLFDWINSESPTYMIMLSYMMPGMPNGFVPYVASRTTVTTKQFFKALIYGAAPQFFTMCFISGRLVRGDVFLSLLVTVLMFVSIVILYIFRNTVIEMEHIMKGKIKSGGGSL